MRSSGGSYLPAIDHMRAFAALLVLFHHGSLWIGERLAGGIRPGSSIANPLQALVFEGHTGVALFMVLSGFIFTYLAYGERVRYVPFVWNRILRIYPLMIFVFLVGWAVRPDLAGPLDLLRLLFIPFAISHPFDFWFIPHIYPFTTLFWAISPEFLFYLIFPFLFALSARFGPKSLIVVIVCAIAIRATMWMANVNPQGISYWTIFGRIDQFLLGMLAAVFCKSSRHANLAWLAPTAVVIIALLLLGFNWLGGLRSRAGWWVLWPTVEGLVWASFIVGYLDFAKRLPHHVGSVLEQIGQVSFSMYLFHVAAIAVVLRIGPIHFGFNGGIDGLLNTIVMVLPLLLSVSWITYHAVELPFLRRRVPYLYPRQSGVIAAAARSQRG